MNLETIVEQGEPIGLYREQRREIRNVRAVTKKPVSIDMGIKTVSFYPHNRTHAVYFDKRDGGRPKIPETYVDELVGFGTSPILKPITTDISGPNTLDMTPQTEEIRYKGHNIRFSALSGKIAVYEITSDNQFIEYGTRNTGDITISSEDLKTFAEGSVQNLKELNTPTCVLYSSKLKYAEK